MSGPDKAVALDGNHPYIAILEIPNRNGRIQLFEYTDPDAIKT